MYVRTLGVTIAIVMSASRVIVIGTSTGGVDALTRLFRGLPRDIPAAICVVMHISPMFDSTLPSILSSVTPLPVHHAISEDPIKNGHVYIAPPNRHLLLEDSRVILTTGPRENRSRPAVDPLFRSAANAYGAKAIGVILTGALDDGTAGLREIKRHGGIAVVQSPQEAISSGMPSNAIRRVDVDYVVALTDMPELLTSLCTSGVER